MSAEKPESITPDQMQDLRLIRTFMSEAQNRFNALPSNLQDYITEFHNENTSLTHCLRWGAQAAEEVIEDLSVEPKQKARHRP